MMTMRIFWGISAIETKKSAEWYLSQLKGHKHLVLGNHDTRLLDNEIAMGYCDSIDRMMYVSDSGKEICLCHYPMSEWNGSYRGHLHFYGHIHDKRDEAWEYMNQGRTLIMWAACYMDTDRYA